MPVRDRWVLDYDIAVAPTAQDCRRSINEVVYGKIPVLLQLPYSFGHNVNPFLCKRFDSSLLDKAFGSIGIVHIQTQGKWRLMDAPGRPPLPNDYSPSRISGDGPAPLPAEILIFPPLPVHDPDLQDAPLPALDLHLFRQQVADFLQPEQVQVERAGYGPGSGAEFLGGHGNWTYPTELSP